MLYHFNLLIVLLFAPLALADIYFHNPRGSNNRLDEDNQQTRNDNRLFDSQNNNNGGYLVGSLYYYAGSNFMMEWTNQHASNNPITHNQFVVQFMCDQHTDGTIRDGTTTQTIPDNPMESKRIEYGQHESYVHYQACKTRERNMGLFTADQLNPNSNNRRTAIHTRQDRNGERHGFECPEERDYYPYWHPSPWVDIAVLTSNMSHCTMYAAESENSDGKGFCTSPEYNNPQTCENNGGQWNVSTPNGFPSPFCSPAPWTRDNHLGNTVGGYASHLNISIPDVEGERCIFRIRYNISTADFDPWNTDARHNTDGNTPDGVEGDPITFNYPDGSGEVQHTQDPNIDIGIGVPLQININTDQFARTFQDRSHTFEIRSPPDGVDPKKIHNLNVRGKRGNIVQVYPAVEYDFVPNVLVINEGEYVHIQWTGSNTNPNGNDGEGKAGTDRSNMVQIGDLAKNYPLPLENVTMFESAEQVRRFALLDSPQFGGETSTLDDAGTYFDGGLIQFKKAGTYHYASTRNNNFTNRSQKGTIIVKGKGNSLSGGAIAGIVVGSIAGVGVVVGTGVGIGAAIYFGKSKLSPA
eukprot:gb/GECH01011229.1/.p1 GENE.gb/GECH01011229.1/~~gb/GECH01011229.1/.p1  ORF type:complete len:580 (+),score=143.45 gb/GECH01011229.1/:1-1740(+)